MEIYPAEGRKLEETIFSVVEPYLNLWYHVYQDDYYNSVEKLIFSHQCGGRGSWQA
jgi:hypothetical protein